jgi:threonine aldolase
MLGKEAALWVCSGTMGNLISLRAQTQPGDQAIMDPDTHCYYTESGHIAAVSGILPRLVEGQHGVLSPDDVRAAIGSFPRSYSTLRLICIENAHNWAGGNSWTVEETRAIRELADELGVGVHLDGARLFNAAAALGVDARELTQPVDTVTICLSKGLSAPMGSLVAGSREFVARARQLRNMMGGSMRQTGIAAAAGIVALTQMVDRIGEDNANASRLREGLLTIQGLEVENPPTPTNLVFTNVAGLGVTAREFLDRLRPKGVLVNPFSDYRSRFVTHRHITPEDVEHTIQAVATTVRELQG